MANTLRVGMAGALCLVTALLVPHTALAQVSPSPSQTSAPNPAPTLVLPAGPTPTASAISQQEIDFRYFTTGLNEGKDRSAWQDVIVLGGGILLGLVLALLAGLLDFFKRGTPVPAAPSPPRPQPGVFYKVNCQHSGRMDVWPPPRPRRFVLLRYAITVSSDATQASGAGVTIDLLDGTRVFQSHTIQIPATVATGQVTPIYESGPVDLADGYRSTGPGNVLRLSLSSSLDTGMVHLSVSGTEE